MDKKNLFSVIYKDSNILVVNKGSGLSVTQDRWDPEIPRLDTLLEDEYGKVFTVHRIDKDTSGVVVYALNPDTHRFLSGEFEERRVEKTYIALVYGSPEWQEKKIEIKLKPDGDSLHRTVADKKHGKYALTKCRVLASSRDFSWIEAKPVTGRTHQIRIHLKEEGFPIVCDSLYGNREGIYLSKLKKNWRGDIFEERPLLSRLGLHALKISLKDPETGEKKTFTAPFPKDLEALRKQLEKVRGLDPVLP